MRRTLAFIGATLAIVAMSAAPASAQLPTANDPRVGLSPGFDNPSVSAAVFDGVNIDKPGRPTIGLGNQGGGKDDVSGFNGLDWVDDWFSDYEEGDGEDFLDEDRARRAGPILASLSVSGSQGSSHREAMAILKDPTSDYEATTYYEPGSVSPYVQ